MKASLVISLLLVGFVPAQADTNTNGTLDFSNYKPGRLDVPFVDVDGVTRLGDKFRAQLYAGRAVNTLAPVGSPVPFRNRPGEITGSGYIIGGKVTLADIGQGATAYVEIRTWEANKGASYEDALAAGSRTRRSSIVQVTTGGDDLSPPLPPAVLVGLQLNLNQPPVSSGFGATTPQNQPLSITFASLLAPVSDPEGDSVHLVSVGTTSTNGAKIASNAAQLVYTPNAGFVGADRFDYVVSDSLGAMNTLPAQIAVLAPGTTVNTVQALVVTAGTASFNFTGLPGRTYVVQRADSLMSPWITVGTLTIQPDGSGNYADPSPPKDAAFYRTILVP